MAATIFQNGIDVSRYQGSIQWPRVAAAGKQFVIARAVSSGGDVYEDPSFEANYQGARAAGLRVGAYYYTYAQNTAYADREIALLSNALRGKQLQYPVFIDVEERRLINLGRAQLTALVIYALQRIAAAGYQAGVYTYSSYANAYLDMAKLTAWPLWLADYTSRVNSNYRGKYDMLQHSSTGRVDGIAGNVDLDVSYVDFAPAPPAPEPPPADFVKMLPAPNLSLTVHGAKNCQYFYSPNVSDVAGTLPMGTYPAVAQSEGCYHGWSWVTVQYGGRVYWTVLLADRCYLIRA